MVRSVHLDCSFWSGRAACLSLAFILLCWEVACGFQCCLTVMIQQFSKIRNLSRSQALRRATQDIAVFEICPEVERCGEQFDVLGCEHNASKSAMDGICVFSSQQSESETSDLEQFCYAFDNWQGVWLGRIASCISGAQQPQSPRLQLSRNLFWFFPFSLFLILDYWLWQQSFLLEVGSSVFLFWPHLLRREIHKQSCHKFILFPLYQDLLHLSDPISSKNRVQIFSQSLTQHSKILSLSLNFLMILLFSITMSVS